VTPAAHLIQAVVANPHAATHAVQLQAAVANPHAATHVVPLRAAVAKAHAADAMQVLWLK